MNAKLHVKAHHMEVIETTLIPHQYDGQSSMSGYKKIIKHHNSMQ